MENPKVVKYHVTKIPITISGWSAVMNIHHRYYDNKYLIFKNTRKKVNYKSDKAKNNSKEKRKNQKKKSI